MSKKIQEKYLKYKNKLKISPNNPIYEYKINKYTKQFNDIHGAGINLEDYIKQNSATTEQDTNIDFNTNITTPQKSMKGEKGEILVEQVIKDLESSQEELQRLKFDYSNFFSQKKNFFKDIEQEHEDLRKAYTLYTAISNEAKDEFDKKIIEFHKKIDEIKKRNF